MATWPHEPNRLTESERRAYRSLLYDAMLDIRNLCQSRGCTSNNPFVWSKQYRQGRMAGELADWLHNLAQFAATDFQTFDTDWFWQEYAGICQRNPDLVGTGKSMDYRERFERHLAEQNVG